MTLKEAFNNYEEKAKLLDIAESDFKEILAKSNLDRNEIKIFYEIYVLHKSGLKLEKEYKISIERINKIYDSALNKIKESD